MIASASARAPAIGIDLGTTFSCVAVLEGDRVQIVKNRKGKSTMPSCVTFDGNRRLVGEDARDRALTDPENTIHNMKRLIGRTLNDAHVKADVQGLPYKVVGDSGGNLRVQVKFEEKDRLFSPEEISAAVIVEMKTMAEEFLGMRVTDAVITVPAYFTNAQRKATIDAGRIAGLKVLATINEPTAAALAYGFNNPVDTESSIALVFDFGGGTFDVSVVKVQNGDVEVLSSDGHGHLGGVDIDELLVKHFCSVFMRKHNIDLFTRTKSDDNTEAREAKRAIRRLRLACEKAKIKLSSERSTRIDLPSLFDGKDLDEKLTRQYFENTCEDLIRETLVMTMRAMETVNLTPEDISEIILVGGSTHIPMVTDMLAEVFPQKEPCKSINPDEAVAYGAAIKAAIMRGTDPKIVRNLSLRDVVPMSLGIEAYGGVMATVIKRNTPLPFQKSKIFSTSKDNQTHLEFKVYEGERHMTKYNNLLGNVFLTGIPPAPRRVPQVEVIFDVDANGILQVKATDLGTEHVSDIKITSRQGRLNRHEMEQAVREAERMKHQDITFRKQVHARERLEVYANQIEKSLQNSKIREKMDAEQLRMITIKIKESLTMSQSFKEPEESDYQEKYDELEKLWLPGMIKMFNQKQCNDDAPVLQTGDSFYKSSDFVLYDD